MDYEAWRFWIDISQVVLTAAIGIYVWVVNRTRVNAARIRKLEDDIDERLDGHDDRLARIESAIEHGPKREDFGRIYARLDEVVQTMSRIEGENQALASNVGLIHQHLLERKS